MLHLSAASLDWALRHALGYGDTDIFPRIIEYDAIAFDWGAVQTYLGQQNVLEWPTRAGRTCIVPKGRYGFRIATQLDPLDFLLFSATVYEIGTEIEARRTAKRRGIVHSWRFDPQADGRLFDPSVGFPSFQRQSRRLAESGDFEFVAMTDISDFYHRIYHHRLENALDAALPNRPHPAAIMGLLRGWGDGVSYGLPVGPAPSRLLAELTVADVDDELQADGFTYVRFSDDFRIFVRTRAEGYRALAHLATKLHNMHGLSLQPAKTRIVTVSEFCERFLPSEEEREVQRLRDSFRDLASSLGLGSEYEEIQLDALTDEQQEFIGSLNLAAMLEAEIQQPESMDLSIVRFVLRRSAQIGDKSLVDLVFEHVDDLYPVFDSIVEYLLALPGLTAEERRRIGRRILRLLDTSMLSELDYFRMWALEPFACTSAWDNAERLPGIVSRFPEVCTRRAAILAMGRAHQASWFSANKSNVMLRSPWEKRAFFAAASCMPSDATRFWYRSLRGRVDVLEQAVVRWASQHPYRQ